MVAFDARMTFLDILTLSSLKVLRYTQLDSADVGGEYTVDPDRLMSILRLLPSLRHLRYKVAVVSRSVFLLLSVVSNFNEADAGDRTIRPLLETLHLQGLEFLEDRVETSEALAEMSGSRAKIQESFRTIRTYINGKRDQILTIDISKLHEHLDDLWIVDPWHPGITLKLGELDFFSLYPGKHVTI